MAITIDEARENVGNGVTYQAHKNAPKEDGKITSVNDTYVMVLYKGDMEPKATSPRDLNFFSNFKEC